jgi:exodeoxyribonuclease-5
MNEQQLNDDPFEGVMPPPPPPPLNEGQQWAHDRTVAYVTNQGPNIPKIILIRGFAGTGKTFTTNRIVKTLQEYCAKNRQRLDIAASAPTHKAVRCLRKAGDLGSGVTYATIHSLLGLRPEPEEKSGKQIFQKSTNPDDGKIGEYNVLILDEISQLGAALWQELMEAMEEHGFKLILLGDEVQIPPVKEKDSLPFLEAELYGIEDTALTQSMRQAGDNPILDYATEIRNTYQTSTWIDYKQYARVNEKGEGLEVFQGTNTKAIKELLEDKFGSDYFRADPDYMKVVAWTNKTVNIFNNQIRRMLYPIPEGMLGLPMIVHGEKLIMNDRYVAAGEFKPIVIPNNEELEVEKYEVVKKAVTYKLWSPLGYVEKHLNPQIYKTLVRFRGINNNWIKATLNIVHETSTTQVQAMMNEISDSAKKAPFGLERRNMWKHFWEIHGLFAQIGYNYALTAHKAQGSTYENCVMIAYDIKQNPRTEERNRIAYVAGTRAKKMLYIIE